MPKRFTENEKTIIKTRLKEEAMNLLRTYGVKKTTVDELVKRVNIPKGTFYLFYDSKELLFFDALNELQALIQNKLMLKLNEMAEDTTVDKITDLFLSLFFEVSQSGLLKIMMSEDMELLLRKLPEQVVMEHLKQDDFYMRELFIMLGINKHQNMEAFSGAFRGVFMTMLYRREIGEMIFDDAIKLMVRGLVIQMLEENDHD